MYRSYCSSAQKAVLDTSSVGWTGQRKQRLEYEI